MSHTTEAEMHAANTAGYEANYEGILLRDNPHPAGSPLANAWEAGPLAYGKRRDGGRCDFTVYALDEQAFDIATVHDDGTPAAAQRARLFAAAPTMHGALIEAAQAAQDAFAEALRDVPEGSCVPPWITRLQQAAERAHAALAMADERFKATGQQPDPTR